MVDEPRRATHHVGQRAGRFGRRSAGDGEPTSRQMSRLGWVFGANGASNHRRGGHSVDALPIRAVRIEPTVRDAVRHRARRPRRRRLTRHGEAIRPVQ